MKECVFCRQILSGNTSREHILPQWLLDDFGIRDHEISPTHFSRDGTTVSTRNHQLKNLVAGQVCSNCNNGWMSALEGRAQPILRDLFENRTSVVDYSTSERFILARWATKTALTLNLGTNFHKNIPQSCYHDLFENESILPARIVVFAQNHHWSQDFYWLQGAIWNVNDPYSSSIPEAEIDYLRNKSFKITFQLKGLLLVLAFNPIESFLYTLWSGIHVPLWPERGPVGYYDRGDFPWDNSDDAVLAFHIGLGLVRKNPECN